MSALKEIKVPIPSPFSHRKFSKKTQNRYVFRVLVGDLGGHLLGADFVPAAKSRFRKHLAQIWREGAARAQAAFGDPICVGKRTTVKIQEGQPDVIDALADALLPLLLGAPAAAVPLTSLTVTPS